MFTVDDPLVRWTLELPLGKRFPDLRVVRFSRPGETERWLRALQQDVGVRTDR
jgi:hypothetical protein